MMKLDRLKPILVCIRASSGDFRFDCLAEDRIRIGRRKENEISISDPDVSRYHAEILPAENKVVLVDRHSSNGVYLNGSRISNVEVNAGDVIEIGRNELIIEPALPKEQAMATFMNKAAEYLNRKKAVFATRVLQRALDLNPVHPGTHFQMARALLEQGRFESAAGIVEKGLSLQPDSAEAYFIKGMIEDGLGNLASAESFYRKSLSLDPAGESVKKKLRVLEEKVGLYDKLKTLTLGGEDNKSDPLPDSWATLESGPFAIRFRLNQDLINVKKIIRTLLRSHQKLGQRYGYFPDRVPVEIFSNTLEFGRRVGSRHEEFALSAAAVTADAIVVCAAPGAIKDPQFLYMVVTHEYVHFMLNVMTGGNCPFWLNEGLAQFESQNLPQRMLNDLEQAAKGEYLLPVEMLEEPFETLQDDRLIRLAYAQSYSLIEYLIEFNGFSWFKEVLHQLKQGHDASEALASLATNYSDLEQGWEAWLKNKSSNEIN